ncbi:MAG: ABC transporter ATP-binding protein [Desulfomonile tiedjei]|uniref:ABC transporter ATP-binding protein n=1 Tax=Desulfomonile tiedjei TaxID=2358 RepID=A0A9D6V5U3_9BACT|nr:ABC transporter ATP-binding protein [Desulfomonile tiedjei]
MNLEIEDLRKVIDNRKHSTVVLDEVQLRIGSGELVSIVGPSGCGKTTLLEIIAGLQSKTEGSILIDQVPIEKSSANRAIVFQQYALFPWLTVQKNIQYGPRIRGVNAPERNRISREYIEMVGLAGFESHYPHELSGGMQQRVALARALANDPDILLLDEPFAALDAQTKENCQQELLYLWEKTGITILFVTHDIGEALFLSDRVFLMTANPGTITECIDVDMARPRRHSVRLDPGFRMKEAQIRSFLYNGVRELGVDQSGGFPVRLAR